MLSAGLTARLLSFSGCCSTFPMLRYKRSSYSWGYAWQFFPPRQGKAEGNPEYWPIQLKRTHQGVEGVFLLHLESFEFTELRLFSMNRWEPSPH